MYTDGSEEDVRSRGSGVFARILEEQTVSYANATGMKSEHFKAETSTMQTTATYNYSRNQTTEDRQSL